MNKEELKETRKQMFAQMEQRLQEIHPKDGDRLFYYHSSEDRIVLSHALFWVMTQPQCLKGKIRKERFFLLYLSPNARSSLNIFRRCSSSAPAFMSFFCCLTQFLSPRVDNN